MLKHIGLFDEIKDELLLNCSSLCQIIKEESGEFCRIERNGGEPIVDEIMDDIVSEKGKFSFEK